MTFRSVLKQPWLWFLAMSIGAFVAAPWLEAVSGKKSLLPDGSLYRLADMLGAGQLGHRVVFAGLMGLIAVYITYHVCDNSFDCANIDPSDSH